MTLRETFFTMGTVWVGVLGAAFFYAAVLLSPSAREQVCGRDSLQSLLDETRLIALRDYLLHLLLIDLVRFLLTYHEPQPRRAFIGATY